MVHNQSHASPAHGVQDQAYTQPPAGCRLSQLDFLTTATENIYLAVQERQGAPGGGQRRDTKIIRDLEHLSYKKRLWASEKTEGDLINT